MFNILGRYITKTIAYSTGLATLVILGVLFLMLLLKEFKSIGVGDYGLGQAFLFVLLRIPNELYQFSPMLILLGCIIGLSLLSSNRELAVMSASGYAIFRIIMQTLCASFILILIM